MKALVVGAGAVGQVFARHLQQAGGEVNFLVRHGHLDRLREGLTLYPLNRRQARSRPLHFDAFQVILDPGEIGARAMIRMLLRLAERRNPFGLERFIAQHYTKLLGA